ncbi:MAG: hypothetical protein KDB21_06530 [Acidimicrobiales bacterium]|nr:hypothetical protein [Acidimicrobiales bacterium]
MQESLDATERWFIRRGLPFAIDAYSVTDDILTRTVPFLSLVFLAEVALAFGDRFTGWGQAAVVVGGWGLLLGAAAVVNRLRGRRALALPDDVGLLEILLFLLAPALLPVVFGQGGVGRAAIVVAVNVGIVVLAFVVTRYALLPMAGFGLRQMVVQIRGLIHLVSRSLPLLLLFATFIFLNAEMWQVAHDFPPLHYAVVTGTLFLLSQLFVLARAPEELMSLARFDSWPDVMSRVRRSGSPLVELEEPPGSTAPEPAPDRKVRHNLVALIVMGHAVQVVVVGLVIGAFYVGFGLFAVRETTILQWTTQDSVHALVRFGLPGGDVVLTWEHLAVSGFIAVFSMLQFTVSSLTDSDFRDQFHADLAEEIRDTLAVRALYLTCMEAHADQPGGPID